MVKRRSENSISLFPFLAVLVCTMGALILLLLVTTRRIRQKQHEQPIAVTQAEFPAETNVVSPVAGEVPANRDSEQSAPLPVITPVDWIRAQTRAALVRNRRQRIEEQLQQVHRSEAANGDLAERLRCQVESLKQQIDAVRQQSQSAQQLSAAEQKLAAQSQRRTQLERRLTELEKELCDAETMLADTDSLACNAEQLVRSRYSALQSLRQLTQQQSMQPADTGTADTVIEFSNSSGTTRTPIIIDVTSEGFVISDTGITLRNDDILGHPLTDNPLLSAVLASHRHRSDGSVTSLPYVLLLIRPGGTLGFYPAQRILKESNIHFGYELVDDKSRYVTAEPAEGEAEAVRQAVLASILRRDKYHAAAATLQRRINAIRDSQRSTSDNPSGSTRRGELPGQQYYSDGSEHGSRWNGADQNNNAAAARHRNPAAQIEPGRKRNNPARQARPIPAWRSVPSPGEAGSHVHRELARALAERDAQQQQRLAAQQSRTQTDPDHSSSSSLPATNTAAPADWVRQGLQDPAGGRQNPEGPTGHQSARQYRSEGNTPRELFAQPASPDQDLQPARSTAMDGQMYHPHSPSPGAASPQSGPGDGRNSAGANSTSGAFAAGARTGSGDSFVSYTAVTVFLDPEYLTIAGQSPINVQGRSRDHLVRRLLDGLFQETRHLAHFDGRTTMPQARFVVSPGAHTLYLQLASELYQLTIPASSIVSMEPYAVGPQSEEDTPLILFGNRSARQTALEKELP